MGHLIWYHTVRFSCGSTETIAKYVREQGKEDYGKYKQLMFDMEGIRWGEYPGPPGCGLLSLGPGKFILTPSGA